MRKVFNPITPPFDQIPDSTDDIAASTDKNYVTDAEKVVIGNTSGTNTGDQDLSAYQLEPSEGAFVNGDKTKLDGIETGADVTDATNVNAAGATMNSDTTLTGNSYFVDEDNMVSDSSTKVPSQQSVKAYADLKLAKASNLSDVASASTSFSNIKQAATTSATGVVELATDVEALAMTDTTRVLTPSNLAALGQVTNFTPTINNLTKGNGTTDYASYVRVGDLVHCAVRFTFGSTSSLSGQIQLVLPIDATTATHTAYGVGVAYDTSATTFYNMAVQGQGIDTVRLSAIGAGATYCTQVATSSTIPFTWATGDIFIMSFTYQGA